MAVIEGLSGEPAEPVSRGWTAAISLANLGLFMAYFGPLAVPLPNQVQAVAGQAHKVAAFGFVSGLGALVAAIADPLAGASSDRTTARFGRLGPGCSGVPLVSALALVMLASQHSVAGITAGWCLARPG